MITSDKENDCLQVRDAPKKAPLCKGGCQKSLISDWGIVRRNVTNLPWFRRKRTIILRQSLRPGVRRVTSLV